MSHGLVNFDLKTGHAKGRFRSLQHNLPLLLEPTGNDAKQSNLPSHSVYLDTKEGPILVGSAWRKIGERGDLAGRAFYSMTLDDPSFDRPLNLFLFPQPQPAGKKPSPDEPAPFDVVWRRERRDAAGV